VADARHRRALAPARERRAQFTVPIGTEQELPRIAALLARESPGVERVGIVAPYGHPAVVDALLPRLAHRDPASAAAATDAFRLLVGEEVTTGARAPPGDAPPARGDAPMARAAGRRGGA
jgi:hypothetical protein